MICICDVQPERLVSVRVRGPTTGSTSTLTTGICEVDTTQNSAPLPFKLLIGSLTSLLRLCFVNQRCYSPLLIFCSWFLISPLAVVVRLNFTVLTWLRQSWSHLQLDISPNCVIGSFPFERVTFVMLHIAAATCQCRSILGEQRICYSICVWKLTLCFCKSVVYIFTCLKLLNVLETPHVFFPEVLNFQMLPLWFSVTEMEPKWALEVGWLLEMKVSFN